MSLQQPCGVVVILLILYNRQLTSTGRADLKKKDGNLGFYQSIVKYFSFCTIPGRVFR